MCIKQNKKYRSIKIRSSKIKYKQNIFLNNVE